MITDIDALRAAIGGHEGEKPVTNQMREDWNKYISWLDSRKMKGHPSLDKNNLGNNMLAKYIKETPGTSLTLDSVIPIQNDFSKYRTWAISQIKAGKGEFGQGTDENNFMKELSVVDGIPGQYTTRHEFPQTWLETFKDGKLVSKENTGFATTDNPVVK